MKGGGFSLNLPSGFVSGDAQPTFDPASVEETKSILNKRQRLMEIQLDPERYFDTT